MNIIDAAAVKNNCYHTGGHVITISRYRRQFDWAG